MSEPTPAHGQPQDLYRSIMRYLYSSAYYVLTHKPSGCFYVGSTRDLGRRMANHRSNLSRGVHPNKKLQEIYTTWSDFEVHYRYRDFDDAKEMEQKLLDKCHGDESCCNVYNDARGAYLQGSLPLDHHFRLTNKNRIIGSNHIQRTIETHRGKVVDLNTRDLLRKKSLDRGPGATKKKGVTIDGVEYPSILSASRSLGVPHPTVRSRINSESIHWVGWKWTD